MSELQEVLGCPWHASGDILRVAGRRYLTTKSRVYDTGFRVVQDPEDRVICGGSWYHDRGYLRGADHTGYRYVWADSRGFRVVCDE